MSMNQDFPQDPGFELVVKAVTDLMVGQRNLSAAHQRIAEGQQGMAVTMQALATQMREMAAGVESSTVESQKQESRFGSLLAALETIA